MMARRVSITLVTVVALAGLAAAQPKHAPPKTDKEKIANAMSAAPKAVAQDATIMDIDEKGGMKVLREGKGTFTCMPDNPTTPGNDPMCLDKAWAGWADAWMKHSNPPPAPGGGIAYMLQGDMGASNTDPFATKASPDNHWVVSPAHIMVLPANSKELDSMPDDPKSGGPWVMWKGTPYAHLMVPVSRTAAAK